MSIQIILVKNKQPVAPNKHIILKNTGISTYAMIPNKTLPTQNKVPAIINCPFKDSSKGSFIDLIIDLGII